MWHTCETELENINKKFADIVGEGSSMQLTHHMSTSESNIIKQQITMNLEMNKLLITNNN